MDATWIIRYRHHRCCIFVTVLGIPSVSYFYSAGCTFANGNFNMTVSYKSGCSYEASTEYYYSQTQSYSYSLQCSSASAYQSTIPALGGAAYAVNT